RRLLPCVAPGWVLDGGEAERDGFGAFLVEAAGERREPYLHPELELLRVRTGVDDVPLHHTAAVELDHRRDIRDRDVGRGPVDDREGPDRAGPRQSLSLELHLAAARAGVTAVEEQRPATGASLSHQMGVTLEHQVIDHGDALFGLTHGRNPSR